MLLLKDLGRKRQVALLNVLVLSHPCRLAASHEYDKDGAEEVDQRKLLADIIESSIESW